jgi:hypothetical protein
MDEFDRFMSRQRALWRAKRKGQNLTSLWDLEHWGDGATEEHHIGRRKFSEKTITIPRAPHPELTRRQMEEHPPEGPDPDNPLEQEGRVHLGLRDLHAALSDGHGMVAERMLEAAGRGERDLKAVHIPEGLLGSLSRIAHDVAQAADRGARESDKR